MVIVVMSYETTVSLDRATISRGAAIGAVTFVVGYLLAFLVASGEISESTPTWKGVAWYFYSAHFADLMVSTSAGQFSGSDTINLVGESAESTIQLLYFVPPVLLALGGALLARILGVTADMAEAAKAGALGVASYLPLTVIGVFLTEHTGTASFGFMEASATWSVQLLPAILLAGILYPLVFGAAGGAAASALEGR